MAVPVAVSRRIYLFFQGLLVLITVKEMFERI